jgi:hypothetical protein
MNGLRLIDDRGHAVELRLFPHLWCELGRNHRAPTPLLSTLRSELVGKALFSLCTCSVVVGLMTLSTLAVGPAIVLIVVFSPVLACLLLLALTSAVHVGEAALEWTSPFTSNCLRAGRCPACAYDLGHLRPEADGLVTCPECGAAWDPRSPNPDAPVVLHEMNAADMDDPKAPPDGIEPR